jgi:hypothetical protein
MALQKAQMDVQCKVDECGQTLVEFTIMVAMSLFVAVALIILLTLLMERGWRIISLLSMNL